MAAEFSSDYAKGKEMHTALISQINLPAGTDRPASIFGQHIEELGFGIKKFHKGIQNERQMLKSQLIGDRARNLPAEDAQAHGLPRLLKLHPWRGRLVS